jgi:hypothetical protein
VTLTFTQGPVIATVGAVKLTNPNMFQIHSMLWLQVSKAHVKVMERAFDVGLPFRQDRNLEYPKSFFSQRLGDRDHAPDTKVTRPKFVKISNCTILMRLPVNVFHERDDRMFFSVKLDQTNMNAIVIRWAYPSKHVIIPFHHVNFVEARPPRRLREYGQLHPNHYSHAVYQMRNR